MHKIVLIRRKTTRELLEEQGFRVISVVERGMDRGDLALIETDNPEIKTMDLQGDRILIEQKDTEELIRAYFRHTGKERLNNLV